MPLFQYRAKTDTGRVMEGELKADSSESLKAHLKEKGYTPILVTEKTGLSNLENLAIFKDPIKSTDMAMFCRQFAIILEAGVPIGTALDVLRTQSVNRTLKDALSDIYENMKKGVALSASMKSHPGIFPNLLVNMVEAGEISGNLEAVFERMAENYEREAKLKQKIQGSLSYPIIVTVVAVAVVFVLMAFVVPKFETILIQMKVKEMPILTKMLMSVSRLFQHNWLTILVFFISMTFAFLFVKKNETGREAIDRILLSMPIVGNIIKNIITVRFTRTLGVLLSSGVLLIQAMEVVQKILGNVVAQQKMEGVIEEIKKGKGLYGPLNATKFFPMMVVSMVKIGEESGELDFSLNKCADYYDQEVERSLQQATALIEPTVMIFLAVVVGGIVLSILTPMFSIYQNMSMHK